MSGSDYSITIQKVVVDGERLFQATIRELPDVVEYGETHVEAYELAVDTIETTAQIFAEKGKQMPSPCRANEAFSGRVTLRLPKSLHKKVAETADLEGVSLNQHIVSILSHYSGYMAATNSLAEQFNSVGIVVSGERIQTSALDSAIPSFNTPRFLESIVSSEVIFLQEEDFVGIKREKLRLVG